MNNPFVLALLTGALVLVVACEGRVNTAVPTQPPPVPPAAAVERTPTRLVTSSGAASSPRFRARLRVGGPIALQGRP